MVTGFRDGQDLLCPVDGGVGYTEPRKSKDNVFSATVYDIEQMFLDNPFNICVEGASIADCTGLVCSLIYILDCDGEGKLFGGEVMFPDKLPVNARDISTRIYQHRGVNDFEGVQGGDQLNRDLHRFIQC